MQCLRRNKKRSYIVFIYFQITRLDPNLVQPKSEPFGMRSLANSCKFRILNNRFYNAMPGDIYHIPDFILVYWHVPVSNGGIHKVIATFGANLDSGTTERSDFTLGIGYIILISAIHYVKHHP